MSKSGLLYALFCLGVVALYFFTARAGYSPFADGYRSGGSGGGGFFYAGRGPGPRHK